MRNNSQNAGCILRLPASHSCQPRRVQWMRAAADVCESPAASRAARTSSGVGFRAGPPARLRFGWLGIKPSRLKCFASLEKLFFGRGCGECLLIGEEGHVRPADIPPACGIVAARLWIAAGHERFDLLLGDGFAHFRLLPTETRGAVEATAYGSNYTRIAYICKGFLKIFFSGRGEAAKPSNDLAKPPGAALCDRSA